MHPCVQQAGRWPDRRQGAGGHQGPDEEGHPGRPQAEAAHKAAPVRQQQSGAHRRQRLSAGHTHPRAHSHGAADHTEGEDAGQGRGLHESPGHSQPLRLTDELMRFYMCLYKGYI